MDKDRELFIREEMIKNISAELTQTHVYLSRAKAELTLSQAELQSVRQELDKLKNPKPEET